jgi:hypothetical protein
LAGEKTALSDEPFAAKPIPADVGPDANAAKAAEEELRMAFTIQPESLRDGPTTGVIESVGRETMYLRDGRRVVIDGAMLGALARDLGDFGTWAGRTIRLHADFAGHRPGIRVEGVPAPTPQDSYGDALRLNYAQAGRHSPWSVETDRC